jgi:flagellar basal body-associated protein FliL
MPGQLGVKIARGQNKVLFLWKFLSDLTKTGAMARMEIMLETETTHGKKRHIKSLPLKLLVLVLLFAVGVLGYFLYITKKETQRLSTIQGQQEVAKKEVEMVTANLGKLTILPQEEPVVATILDAPFLATQSAFYQHAENGDKLIVYPQAQKAFIYSPTKNIIVNAGPLVLDQNQNSRPVRFEIRSGTTNETAVTEVKTKLEQEQQLVSALTNASRKDYTQTLVVVMNPGIKPDQLNQFAENLDAKVATELPSGEATSEADILIIVGSAQGNSTTTAN